VVIEPKSDYPVVVVGAGLGVLCCGAYLSRFGFSVTVVEQHSIPGGYATSFDRVGGKFTFEVSLKATCIHNNTTAQILKDFGVLEKLQLVELPEILRIKGVNFEIQVLSRDPETLIVRLSEHFPEEKEGIRAIVQEMMGIAEVDIRGEYDFALIIGPRQYLPERADDATPATHHDNFRVISLKCGSVILCFLEASRTLSVASASFRI
jgi:phytoene dehydrogenase-like protein